MTITFEVEERVERGPEVVWKRLTDWGRAAEWMDGIGSFKAEGPTEVGTTLVFEARGKRRTTEITHLVDGRELTLTSRQGPVTAAYTYRCIPDGDGTRLGLVAECRIRGPLRIAAPLLRFLIRRSDSGQVSALKRLVESWPLPSRSP